MDFDDTPEEAAFRAGTRAWLAANAVAKGEPGDFSAGAFAGEIAPEEYVKRCRWWQGQLHDAGYAGISWPREFGGQGGRPIQEAIFAEEQAKWGVSVGVFAVAHGMVAPTLMAHATPEQQARYLGPMLRGEELWCQLFSEPEAGSDLASLKTRALRDGDEFVVDGQKVWTSYAHAAEWGILIARTDQGAERHAGITFFVIDMHSPGIDVRPLRQMNGEAHFNEVFLTGVRVPAENVIGEVGGFRLAMLGLNAMRPIVAARGIGLAEGALMYAVNYAKERAAFGATIADFQGIQWKVAELAAEIEAARLLTYRAAWMADRGEFTREYVPFLSMAKYYATELAVKVSNEALQMLGAAGYMKDHMTELYYRDAKQLTIVEGTSQIQLGLIAGGVLRGDLWWD